MMPSRDFDGKIVHIITGLGQGGAEGALFKLCAYRETDRSDIHVVSLRGRGVYAEQLEKIGVRVTDLQFGNGLKWMRGVVGVMLEMRRDRPVVQTWMYHADLLGGLMARLAGARRIVWNIRHTDIGCRRNKWTTVAVAHCCAVLSRWLPEKIISCSEAAMHSHVAIGYQADRFVKIANGYDFFRFFMDAPARARARADLGIGADEFVVGMVARADRQKDHASLVAAVGSMVQRGVKVRCVFIGRGVGPDDEWIRLLAESAGVADHIRMLGSRSDVPSLMRAFDLHVLASFGEGFPNVLVEAMASGTPCVSSDVGDAREIIDVHGWLVPPGQPDALESAITAAMKEWADTPDLWEQRRERSRQHVQQLFDMKVMLRRYDAVWASLSGVLSDGGSR